MARPDPQRLLALDWYDAGHARTVKGRYTTAANALIPLNEKWSQKLQKQAAARLELTRVGPKDGRRKFRHLSSSIKDPENVLFSDTGFGFFKPAHMDKATPYWRQIEEGSRVHVGRRQYMAFAGPFGVIGPIRDRFRMDPWRTSGTKGGSAWRGTIRRPIGAHRFLEDTFASWDKDAYTKAWSATVQKAFREVARGG